MVNNDLVKALRIEENDLLKKLKAIRSLIKNYEDETTEILKLPISFLELSSRSVKVIRGYNRFNNKNELYTLGDLCSLSGYEIMKIRNCGKGTLIDIAKYLHQYNLKLQPSFWDKYINEHLERKDKIKQ